MNKSEIAEKAARDFHETYERLAPEFGYQTRRESALPWEDIADNHKRLMVAVCAEVVERAIAESQAPQLPEHKCGLFLTHNEHRDYYEPIVEYIESLGAKGDFESESAYKRSVETDELWVLQWYPDTPVGFCRVAAPTLQEVLKLANEDNEPPKGNENV